ncbi:MAG: tetratricopeptide repeat protein [Spirochaetes bacterium]|nr:tetratricopeptide repeat protein [Spirochaetota bacterium]
MQLKEKLNEKSNKFKFITPVIIISIILITLIIITFSYFYNLKEENAVKLFERAYVKISDFNDSEFEKKQSMSGDIIKTLDRTIAKFPKTVSGKRALFYKGYVLFHSEKYDEAETVFLDFIKKNKNHFLTGKAYYFLSYCYSERKNIEKAIETLKVFENEQHDSAFAPIAYYQIGFLYENLKDTDNAVTYYQKILNDFKKSSQYDYAVKKVYLLKNNIRLTEKEFFK